MLDEARYPQDRGQQLHPVCPYFRLLADPEARALSLSEQRFCWAAHQPLPDMAWQANYCLGPFERCPHWRQQHGTPRSEARGASPTLLDLLAAQQPRREWEAGATVRFGNAARGTQHEASTSEPNRRQALRERLAELVRRPLVVAVTTAALIGGLWAGIALADTLGANRPTADAGQRATAQAPAFTLRTQRATPTPTPYPAPAQLPALPALSVSRAATPTPSVQATPTAVPQPSPTPATPTPPATPTAVPSPTSPPVTSGTVPSPGETSPERAVTPTPTPSPWPSVEPTPVVTPTPLPTATPTPLPTPTPTPDPWASLPPMARAGQPVPVTTVGHLLARMTPYPFAGNALAGTAPPAGAAAELALPGNAGVIYGLQSGASSGRIWLNTPQPAQRLILVAEGMSNPGPLAPVLRISVNGITLWEGVSPFPHGDWSTVAWVIDKPQILATSQLQIALSLATPGEAGQEPWVALASVTVYVE